MKIRGNTITILQRSLLLAGGTMEGTLEMNGNPITGLPAPSKTTDAVRKTDLDKMVPLSGGKMTGVLYLPRLRITDTKDIDQTIQFMDEADNIKLSLYPDSEGKLRIRQVEPNTQKSEYFMLPVVTSGITANATYKILTSKEPVSIAEGGTGAKTAANALANLGGLPLSGGTMTGALKMNSNSITGLPAPTESSHAVNKSYADGIKETANNALSKANQAYSDANAAGAIASAAQQIANAAIPSSEKATANGVATLNSNGKVLPKQVRSSIRTISGTDHTLTANDGGYLLSVRNSNQNCTITIPDSDELETGTEIEILRYTKGTVTVEAPSNISLLYAGASNTSAGGSLSIAHVYGFVALKKVTSTVWMASGDIE